LHGPTPVVSLARGAPARCGLAIGRARVACRAILRTLPPLATDLLLPTETPRLGAVGGCGPPTRCLVADLPKEGGQLALALIPSALREKVREVGSGLIQSMILVESPGDS